MSDYSISSNTDNLNDQSAYCPINDYKQDLQDLYCKIGQSITITFQLAGACSEPLKSIKILNPKKLFINSNTNPNIGILTEDDNRTVRLKVNTRVCMYSSTCELLSKTDFLFLSIATTTKKIQNITKNDIGEYECLFNTKSGVSISNRTRLHLKPHFNSSLNLYSQNKNFCEINFSSNRFDYEDMVELAR